MQKRTEIAERSIVKGNEEIGEMMRSTSINREKRVGCQNEFSTGNFSLSRLKLKRELH